MEKEERTALLTRAIRTYGEPAQIDMAIEEMAELTKALCKIKRAQAGCEVTAAIGNVVEEAKLERLAGRLHTRYIENGMIREAERGRSQ